MTTNWRIRYVVSKRRKMEMRGCLHWIFERNRQLKQTHLLFEPFIKSVFKRRQRAALYRWRDQMLIVEDRHDCVVVQRFTNAQKNVFLSLRGWMAAKKHREHALLALVFPSLKAMPRLVLQVSLGLSLRLMRVQGSVYFSFLLGSYFMWNAVLDS